MQKFPRRRRRVPYRRAVALCSAVLTVLAGAAVVDGGTAAAAAGPTTAWQHGDFALDPAGVVSRSDIVLGSPNSDPTASMPLGNGSLGVAAWAAGGFTAQLNRSDTMPDRKSPGQLNIPGLSVISHAADFRGQLDLTDGVLRESGGGMSMKAWVAAEKDELIVDVSGADPGVAQTATINLWSPRKPDRRRVRHRRHPGRDLGRRQPADRQRKDLRLARRHHRGRPPGEHHRQRARRRSRSASPRTPTAPSGSSSPRRAGPAATPPRPPPR